MESKGCKPFYVEARLDVVCVRAEKRQRQRDPCFVFNFGCCVFLQCNEKSTGQITKKTMADFDDITNTVATYTISNNSDSKDLPCVPVAKLDHQGGSGSGNGHNDGEPVQVVRFTS